MVAKALPVAVRAANVKSISGKDYVPPGGGKGKIKHPKPERKPLPVPKDLPRAQHADWVKFALATSQLGISTKYDEESLRQLCTAKHDLKAAREALDKSGHTYETFGPSGRMVRTHPNFPRYVRLATAYRLLLVEHGLTPSARGRMRNLNAEDDETEETEHFD